MKRFINNDTGQIVKSKADLIRPKYRQLRAENTLSDLGASGLSLSVTLKTAIYYVDIRSQAHSVSAILD